MTRYAPQHIQQRLENVRYRAVESARAVHDRREDLETEARTDDEKRIARGYIAMAEWRSDLDERCVAAYEALVRGEEVRR